jgi:hypothetical protein
MMKKPTEVSAVASAPRLIVKEPAPGTTFFMYAVVSFVLTTAKTIDDVVQSEFVTTNDVAPAAKFTVPDGLLIVCAPVVPDAVLVAQYVFLPSERMRKMSLPSEFSKFTISDDEEFPALRTSSLADGESLFMPTFFDVLI